MPILLTSFQKVKKKHFINHYMMAVLPWYQIRQEIPRKLHTKILININAEIFNKMPKRIQQPIKRDYIPWPSGTHSWNERLVQHMKPDQCNMLHQQNKGKKSTWSSQLKSILTATKSTWENSTIFLRTTPSKLRIEGNCLDLIKSIYNFTANIKLMVKD